jgi:Mn-dependent DtxR family transcriptional regulator
MRIHSGYKTITPAQLANLVWALNEGEIDLRAARTHLACFALIAVREAAARCRRRQGRKPKEISRYRLNELERLTGLGPANVRRALRSLDRAGLVSFSENEIVITKETLPGSEEMHHALACRRSQKRPIPVPRSVLRFLAKNRSEALLKTVVAYLVRGLSIARRTGEVCAKGTVKASWIAKTFGVSPRAVKYAQAELLAMDWISKDTQSRQRKLNRDGAYFIINLEWRFETATQRQNEQATESHMDIVNGDNSCSDFARPLSEKIPDFAPPIQNKKTSIEIKNQKTQPTEPSVAGVCGEGRESSSPPPSLDHIQRQDLHHFSRLEELYFQAVERGWISPSEAMALNFIAAAVRAREVGDEPARLFVSLIRRRLWHHITQAQEDCARRALARYREENPERFRFVTMRTGVKERKPQAAA